MKAIILAAGKGERLKPFTDRLPKPLFQINNETLIERTINYLLSKNINDIFIITGYKSEELQFLEKKYKNVKLIYNESYDKYNNFYSLLKAENKLNDDWLKLSGDIYINNDFLKSFKNSNKSLVFIQKNNSNCEEWEVIFDKDNKIVDVNKNSTSGYCMINIIFLKKDIMQDFIKELKKSKINDYYEDAIIKLVKYKNIYIKKLKSNSIIEIDCLDDLKKFNLIKKKKLCKTTQNIT